MTVTSVREVPSQYQYVSNDREVDEIKAQLPPVAWDFGRQFDSFFVWQRDGELVSVFGMFGVVPYLDGTVFKVL